MSTFDAVERLQTVACHLLCRAKPVRLPRELVDLAGEFEAEGMSFYDALKAAADVLPSLTAYARAWDADLLAVTL